MLNILVAAVVCHAMCINAHSTSFTTFNPIVKLADNSTKMLSVVNNTTTKANKTLVCDSFSPSSVEADKCCTFPDLLPDVLIDQCEKGFSLNESLITNDIFADSCIIDCVFNRSGLQNQSSLIRDDAIKLFLNRTKEDKIWNSLIAKATDTCFNEVSTEAVGDFVQSLLKETAESKKQSLRKLCNPRAAFILDCIYMELFKICPREKFNQTTPGCSQLQSHALECDEW